jgi:hypothetical protein
MNGSFQSGGRNPNQQRTCCYPRCAWLMPAEPGRDGGWCGHKENRRPPEKGWPLGFAPSVASNGGCDLHQVLEGEGT